MTQFQSDLIVTLLDTFAFLCLTTDLYGRWLAVADQVKNTYLPLVRAVDQLVGGFGGHCSPSASF